MPDNPQPPAKAVFADREYVRRQILVAAKMREIEEKLRNMNRGNAPVSAAGVDKEPAANP